MSSLVERRTRETSQVLNYLTQVVQRARSRSRALLDVSKDYSAAAGGKISIQISVYRTELVTEAAAGIVIAPQEQHDTNTFKTN
jgi:hypothetical protein